MKQNKSMLTFLVLGAAASTLVLTGCGKDDSVEELGYQSPEYNEVGSDSSEDSAVARSADIVEDVDMVKEAPGNRGKKRDIPEEVIEVCENKSEGDACEFVMVTPDGTEESVVGECRVTPMDDNQLICASENMQRGPGGGRSGM